MLRSIEAGITRFIHNLNGFRAMTLCCKANSDIRVGKLTTKLPSFIGTTVPVSIDFVTTKPVTKPMA